jgi:hypothetical protein
MREVMILQCSTAGTLSPPLGDAKRDGHGEKEWFI